MEVFDIRRNSLIMIGVTVVVVLVIIGVTAAVITQNSTENNTTTNNTTVNATNNTTVNATNNTTSNNTNTTSTKSSSKKSKSSSSDDDSAYHYSAQYGTYIKEWDDGHGNSYMRSKNGEFYEHYNEKTGFYETNYPGEGYVHN